MGSNYTFTQCLGWSAFMLIAAFSCAAIILVAMVLLKFYGYYAGVPMAIIVIWFILALSWWKDFGR